MKNHLLEKLHPNLNGGTPLNIFKIPKNLTQKKLRGFQDLEAKKLKKRFGILRTYAWPIWDDSNGNKTNLSQIHGGNLHLMHVNLEKVTSFIQA